MDLDALQDRLRQFARTRDWEKYHNPKNLSMALAVEAAELMEIFQWLTPHESQSIMNSKGEKEHGEDEVADVFIYLLRIVESLDIDLEQVAIRKMEKNAEKYPAPSGDPA